MFGRGSFPALVAHDVRLALRRTFSRFSSLQASTAVVIAVAVFFVLHLIAWGGLKWVSSLHSLQDDQQSHLLVLTCAFVFIFPWMISQAINMATRLLYSYGDLDLWLASPIPQRRIVAAHATAIAIDSMLSLGILLVPLIDSLILIDGLRWTALYPTLIASCLLATALGLAATVGLFRLIGPRRTRTAAQIMSTLIGAAFVVALQALQMVPDHLREQITAGIVPQAQDGVGRISPWLMPVYAATGDLSALLIWCLIATFAFVAMAIVVGPMFCDSAMTAAGSPSDGRRHQDLNSRSKRPFRHGLGAIVRHKELRLVLRDPWLLSQLALQITYTLPVALIVWRNQNGEGSLALSVSPAIIVIASQISASLAWLAISGEQAPELLACAPVKKSAIERRKLESLILPIALALLIPVAALAMNSFETAALTFVFGIAAATSTALLNLWNPASGQRAQLMRRHAQSKIVALFEHGMSICWAIALVLTAIGSLLALIPIALVGGMLWLNWRKANKPKALEIVHVMA